MVTSTTSRLQQIASEVQLDMVEEIRKASLITDPTAMIAAINEVNSKVNTRAQERYDKEVTARKATVEAQTKAGEGFQVQAADVLTKAWKELAVNADKLTTVPMFIFRVERGEDGKLGSPTFIVGKVTKLPTNGSGSTKNYKVTVDGATYATIAIAWKALMPGVDAPNKSATGRDAYSLLECKPLMETAGHKFD